MVGTVPGSIPGAALWRIVRREMHTEEVPQMSRNRPTNSDDVIDSREVIEAIEELRALLADADEDGDEMADELAALEALADEGAELADWQYGETLVRDSYFEDYARELADDIGAINRDAGWPMTYINWTAAAEALQMDYTAIDFDGVTYWGRA